MSAKKYGIYQVSVLHDRGTLGKLLFFFEVSFIDFSGATNILCNSKNEPYIAHGSYKAAEANGLDWLYDHLEKQLKEVKEALDNV